MGFKFLKSLLFLIITITIVKCGRGAACAGNSYSLVQADLVVLSPLQNTYNQGDEITVKVRVPIALSKTVFDISGNTLGEFGFTLFADNDRNLFNGNTITFLRGLPSTTNIGFFLIPYDFTTGSYEFEIKVKFNRLGSYTIASKKNSDFITFKGPDECKTVTIQTNKVNPSNTNEIIFTVI